MWVTKTVSTEEGNVWQANVKVLSLSKHYSPHQSSLIRPQLIVAVLRNVPHPGQSLIATLLDDLEVAYLNT